MFFPFLCPRRLAPLRPAPRPGKIGGGSAVARVFGMNVRESLAVGVLMNTRGLVELIILNIGLDAGVLTEVRKVTLMPKLVLVLMLTLMFFMFVLRSWSWS